jgi:hypothetical protein
VLALAKTIKYFNNYFNVKKPFKDGKLKLNFKGTAWIAGFPATNIELDLSRTKEQSEKDFLGPSMDLGFRISEFASKDRLIISASLAYFIACESCRKKRNTIIKNPISLCFGGMVEVKGVKRGEHPLIWYSVMNTKESKLCFVEHKKLLNYFEKNHFDLDIFPFIPNTDKFDLKYDKYYKKAVKEQKKILGSLFYKKRKEPV